MKVELASADLHVRMVEAFGLPVPTDDTDEHVVDVCHFDDDTQFWLYHPQTQTWRVVSGGDTRGRPLVADPDWSEADEESLARAMSMLSLMPPPPPPYDHSRRMQMERFAYEEWLFAWCFFPELRRWELAPLGRR